MAPVLPMLLGILLTPIGVIPPILLLFSRQPRASTAAFLCAWAMGVTAGFLLGIAAADLLADHTPGMAMHALRIAAGLLLLWLAARQWAARKAGGEMPGWMRALSDSTPGKSFRLGLLLTLANPKILLLALAAGIATADFAPHAPVIRSALLFGAVASILAAAPLVAHLIAGDRILEPIGRLRDWLVRNNAVILAVVLLAIGLALLSKGISGLTA